MICVFYMFKTQHPLYSIWIDMIRRCKPTSHKRTKYHGQRGITVCDRWLNDFWAFVEDMGIRPPNTSIDRIKNNEGYSPDNCRWATRSQQNLNRNPYRILRRKLQFNPSINPMRNIRRRNNAYQVRMRVNKKVICKHFKTLTEAISFRADLEDEQAMMALLS